MNRRELLKWIPPVVIAVTLPAHAETSATVVTVEQPPEDPPVEEPPKECKKKCDHPGKPHQCHDDELPGGKKKPKHKHDKGKGRRPLEHKK